MSQFVQDLSKWVKHLAGDESEMVIEAGLILHKYQLDLYYQAKRDGLLDTSCPPELRESGSRELLLTLSGVNPAMRVQMGIISYIQYSGLRLAFEDQQPLVYITDGNWTYDNDIESFHNTYLYLANQLDSAARVATQALERDMSESMISKERTSGIMSAAVIILFLFLLIANLIIAIYK